VDSVGGCHPRAAPGKSGIEAHSIAHDPDESVRDNSAGERPPAQTLDQLMGLPTPVVLLGLAGLAIAGFYFGSRLERKFGGPVQAKDILELSPTKD